MFKKLILGAVLPAAVLLWSGCKDGSGNSGLIPLNFGPTPVAENPGGPETSSELITVADGGRVSLGDEVTLSFPPGSVKEDTRVSIERLNESPDGAADGFSKTGRAYRFSPPGAKFNLDKPAILTMKYDSAKLTSMGLESRTMQVYYFDEEQSRYVNVAGHVDVDRGVVTARVEHFTIYVPLAMSLVPGNNLPTAALQNPIPNTVRANAPIYFRATARDFDLAGSVSGAQLCWQKLQPVASGFTCEPMTREKRDGVLDTYAYLAPANTITPADLGAGNDIEYFVRVFDNLGAMRDSGSQFRNITRTYNAASMFLNPAVQSMTAGSIRTFAVQGVDDFGTTFTFIPESTSVLAGAGNILRTEANGVTFQATTSVVGGLQANSGGDTAMNMINVFLGELDRIEILDASSMPISGTLTVKEGQLVQFDARGYDAFGNLILINPAWSNATGTIGNPVDPNGLLYTLDGSGFGSLQLDLGNVSAVQHINVLDRNFLIHGNLVPTNMIHAAMASAGGNVYIAGQNFAPNPATPEINVFSWNGATWNQVGASLGVGQFPDVAAHGSSIFAAITTTSSPNAPVVQSWNGFAWVGMGPPLSVNAANHAGRPSIATDGTDIYVAFQEFIPAGHHHVYVKRWTGATWAQVGGPLNLNAAENAIGAKLKLLGGVPYVSFTQTTGGVEMMVVRRWDGFNWIQVGAALNNVAANNAPAHGHDLAFDGAGNPHVAFLENNGTRSELFVKRFDGTNWVSVGAGTLNDGATDTAGPPALTFFTSAAGDVPYIMWQERPDLVSPSGVAIMKHWNGTAWLEDNRVASGFEPGNNTIFPTGITMLGSTPFGFFVGWDAPATAFHPIPLRLD